MTRSLVLILVLCTASLAQVETHIQPLTGGTLFESETIGGTWHESWTTLAFEERGHVAIPKFDTLGGTRVLQSMDIRLDVDYFVDGVWYGPGSFYSIATDVSAIANHELFAAPNLAIADSDSSQAGQLGPFDVFHGIVTGESLHSIQSFIDKQFYTYDSASPFPGLPIAPMQYSFRAWTKFVHNGATLPEGILVHEMAGALRVDYHFTGVESAWTNLGGALGAAGELPWLVGSGPLTASSNTSLDLGGFDPAEVATLILSAVPINASFKGGTLVPDPSVGVLLPLTMDSQGLAHLAFTWPTLPVGTSVLFQAWSAPLDPGESWTATNAVEATSA